MKTTIINKLVLSNVRSFWLAVPLVAGFLSGKYELLYSCSVVNLRVVTLLFGTNELAPFSMLSRLFL